MDLLSSSSSFAFSSSWLRCSLWLSRWLLFFACLLVRSYLRRCLRTVQLPLLAHNDFDGWTFSTLQWILNDDVQYAWVIANLNHPPTANLKSFDLLLRWLCFYSFFDFDSFLCWAVFFFSGGEIRVARDAWKQTIKQVDWSRKVWWGWSRGFSRRTQLEPTHSSKYKFTTVSIWVVNQNGTPLVSEAKNEQVDQMLTSSMSWSCFMNWANL